MPITFEHVSHIYSDGTPYRYVALSDVSLNLTEGKITAIIGQTGSGKSTLVQHLNALLLPSSGTVKVLDRTIEAGTQPKGLKSLRGRVGLVFQFPEYQLFEETVLKDVAFGPKNFGVSEEDAVVKAKAALKMVDLGSEYYERSPLELSGGQKRRAAIAGILAMDPQVLVLDEPTAGLDPQGTIEMMKLFYNLNRKYQKTVLIVTHDMEQVFKYCDEVVVMANGKPMIKTDVKSFFEDSTRCEQLNILPPALIRMRDALRARGFDIPSGADDIDALAACIAKQVKHHG
ncbi:MAG: energy-coupling factor transporter ATPase [Solobacterium sp.]|nr:energy-coupling factor transporter ATPase [Solobacterium sp.]MCH4222562.1 energy-coupling factor transporter ATPase [Solobacterium sp.]MCH4265409.1 energy-coupling factor transporter ATPase [Solobacterium sp.]